MTYGSEWVIRVYAGFFCCPPGLPHYYTKAVTSNCLQNEAVATLTGNGCEMVQFPPKRAHSCHFLSHHPAISLCIFLVADPSCMVATLPCSADYSWGMSPTEGSTVIFQLPDLNHEPLLSWADPLPQCHTVQARMLLCVTAWLNPNLISVYILDQLNLT